jgi:glyoxylase-like metal-dependent hydrolase (beta-lactamase superfamily II)
MDAGKVDLGGMTVTLLRGGALRLDGGAMFGIIPKPLWSRATPADEQNRIQLACNCLLIETAGPAARRVIVETGHGAKYAAKEQGIFAIDATRWLRHALQDAGVGPETIDDVVLTHLHFDHAGGLSRALDDDPQRFAPTFPRARVHVPKLEFEDARANFGIMTATYREENFAPVDEADAWRLLAGEVEILPGFESLPTPGHTRGHHSVIIRGRSRTLVFPGDVMPTRAHVGPPYNMGYDVLPLDNRESKRRLLEQAAAEDWLIVLDHEPQTPLVRCIADGHWFRLEPA